MELTRDEALKIALECGELLKNGIIVGDNVLSFTLLDYYTLFDIDYSEVYRIVKCDKRNFSKEISYLKALFLHFCVNKIILKKEVSDASSILAEKNAFVINGERFVPTEKDIIDIFDLFDQINLPKNPGLIYIALQRLAKGCPVLPLLDEKKKNIFSK